MRSAPSSRREHALPEIVVLGPAKPNFLGWTGSPNASLFDSKGKSCQLPGFKPAVLLLSKLISQARHCDEEAEWDKGGQTLGTESTTLRNPAAGQSWDKPEVRLGDIKGLGPSFCHPSSLTHPRKGGRSFSKSATATAGDCLTLLAS